jgi:hypothetical protein
MLALLCDLMTHAEWANAVYFHTWGKSAARDHEELRRRVHHIIGVQQGFLSVFRGEPPGGPPDGPPSTFDHLKAWAETCHAALRDFRATLDQAGLLRTVRLSMTPCQACGVPLSSGACAGSALLPRNISTTRTA